MAETRRLCEAAGLSTPLLGGRADDGSRSRNDHPRRRAPRALAHPWSAAMPSASTGSCARRPNRLMRRRSSSPSRRKPAGSSAALIGPDATWRRRASTHLSGAASSAGRRCRGGRHPACRWASAWLAKACRSNRNMRRALAGGLRIASPSPRSPCGHAGSRFARCIQKRLRTPQCAANGAFSDSTTSLKDDRAIVSFVAQAPRTSR